MRDCPAIPFRRDYIERRSAYAVTSTATWSRISTIAGPQVLGEILPSVLQGVPPTTVLDAGCGTGLCAQCWRPMRWPWKVDLSASMLRHAAQRAVQHAGSGRVEWMAARPARMASSLPAMS
jgi:SAM-dependent methyltransferase